MLRAYRAWRRRRILDKYPLDSGLWQRLASRLAFVTRLTEQEQTRLRELCVLFLHEKQINAAGDFVLDDEMKLGIAIQACILILNLSLDSYDGWVEVIVYPDEFMPRLRRPGMAARPGDPVLEQRRERLAARRSERGDTRICPQTGHAQRRC